MNIHNIQYKHQKKKKFVNIQSKNQIKIVSVQYKYQKNCIYSVQKTLQNPK